MEEHQLAKYIRDQYKEPYASGKGYGLTISVPPDSDYSSWWATGKTGSYGNKPLGNRIGVYSGRLFDTANPVANWNKQNEGAW
jgi:hypothetical protein